MSDPLDFTGKRVLVIGGSGGIGNGIAQSFVRRGADVIVTGTRPDAGDYLRSAYAQGAERCPGADRK